MLKCLRKSIEQVFDFIDDAKHEIGSILRV